MTEYRSIHKGTTIDNTISTVINHDSIVKWGNIEGQLSSQTDLYNALDNKVNKTTTVNGKALKQNITLNYSDVGALSDSTPLATSLGISNLTISLKDQNENVLSEQTIPTYNSVTIDSLVNGRANRDLSNLTEAGEAHFSNADLSNLSWIGEAHFANPSLSNLTEVGEVKFRKSPALSVLSGQLNEGGALNLINAIESTSSDTTYEFFEPGTYTIYVPQTGTYEVEAISGGAGGGDYDTGQAVWVAYSGASGAYFKGKLIVSAGSHTVTVGNGGYYGGLSTSSGSGGSTSLDSNFILSGGTGGKGNAGGQLVEGSIISETIEYTVGTSGTAKSADSSSVTSLYVSPNYIPSLPQEIEKQGFGSNGCSPYSRNNQRGGSGYFKIKIVNYQAGSEEIKYNVSPATPLVIANEKSEPFTFYGLNSDFIDDNMNGTYNKFISSEGSELLQGILFKCLESPKNYKTIGSSVTVNSNYVASGFTDDSFLLTAKSLPFSVATTWHIDIRFRYVSSGSLQILFKEAGYALGSYVGISEGGKIKFGITAGNLSYIANTTGSTVLSNNTIYQLRLEFTGTAYNVYLVGDGGSFSGQTPEIAVSNTTKLRDLVWCIGKSNAGSIDLSYFSVVADNLECSRLIPKNNDVWIKGNSPVEIYKFNGEAWEPYNKVYIGSLVVRNGNLIQKKESFLYNNNYDILGGQTQRYVVESYNGDTSWYTLYSDGWLVQGGSYMEYSSATDVRVTIKLLKNYRDTSYQAFRGSRWYQSTTIDARSVGIWSRTPSTFEISVSINSPSGGVGWDWMTMGWAE